MSTTPETLRIVIPLTLRRRNGRPRIQPPADYLPENEGGADPHVLIQAVGAGLRSLAEPWADTTTPAGRMVLTVFAGIAEFERSLIIDRTRNGREAAKARGVKFGPRPTLTPAQIEHARELIDRDGRTVKEAAELLAVHRSTLYRALARGEEVTKTEARRRGAFAEDALSEADALAAVDDERQEEGPAFLDGDGPAADLPPPPYRTQSLPQILAALPDDELASWPGELADQEGVVSENGK